MRSTAVRPFTVKSEPGVNFLKAWGDAGTGKIFCLSEGPSRDAVQRVYERAGHPADEIYEITVEQ